MKISLTTVATFNNVIEAHLAKTKLYSEGIDSFLMDDHVVSINPLLNLTIGGIKLKTKSLDADRAMELLGLKSN